MDAQPPLPRIACSLAIPCTTHHKPPRPSAAPPPPTTRVPTHLRAPSPPRLDKNFCKASSLLDTILPPDHAMLRGGRKPATTVKISPQHHPLLLPRLHRQGAVGQRDWGGQEAYRFGGGGAFLVMWDRSMMVDFLAAGAAPLAACMRTVGPVVVFVSWGCKL